METIDLSTWPRSEAFKMFSGMEYPFYSVTMPVDITNVKKAARARELSFYCLMIWLCTKALNSVPQFRLRMRGEQLVLLDKTDPSFTALNRGEEQFRIVTLPWEEDMLSFCKKAKEKSRRQTKFIEDDKETDSLIYFSCTPWFDFTALTNEHTLDKNDFIPRVAWGKYYEQNGSLFVHLSVEVNHRVIDGVHLGRLKEAIDAEIAALGGQ